MEIKASCDYNKKCLKTVAKTSQKTIYIILFLSIFVLALLFVELFVFKEDDKIFFTIMFTLCSVNILIILLRMFILRKSTKKQLKDKTHLDYVFREDSVSIDVSKNGEWSVTETVKYQNFVKISETNDYVMIFLNRVMVD